MGEHRTTQVLRELGRRYPGAWRAIEDFRAQRRELGGWPEWCYCPLAGAYAVVSGGSNAPLSLQRAGDIGAVGALAAWRPTQGIYRFDPELARAIADTPLDRDLPVQALQRLPEWCVYVEAQGGIADEGTAGWWAHLEHDVGSGVAELRLLILLDSGQLVPVPIHLTGSLTDGLRDAARGAAVQQALRTDSAAAAPPLERAAGWLSPMVSLVLYLCSEEPDLHAPRYPERKPAREYVGSKKRRQVPGAPILWETGFSLGTRLREAIEETGHRGPGPTPRPHVRRAHWHTYRVGKGRAQSVLKWVHPTIVGGAEAPPTVRHVKPRR